jgi:hypothetical protein
MTDGTGPTDGLDHPPRMLRQPAEPLPELGRIADSEPVRTLRRELSSRREHPDARRSRPVRARARAWAGRVTGRADRRLLDAIAGATEVLVRQCDLIIDRLETQEHQISDITQALGEDITHLRAEVLHVRGLVASVEHHENE